MFGIVHLALVAFLFTVSISLGLALTYMCYLTLLLCRKDEIAVLEFENTFVQPSTTIQIDS